MNRPLEIRAFGGARILGLLIRRIVSKIDILRKKEWIVGFSSF